ncbi:bacterio-opsin activator domain-containing protein [Haloplanus pelagicus]|jgi:PAS domain S-box-containing protein|uniref:bacterio-opsin activator domain-containing protein n=1 Tax=Haloplanus pelagicus TaxID=2949995 RepID=UPI00273A5F13|nr:bacterio-opsin activator domain-containing protein [Haloplanus sp. HW8-1]
MSTPETQSTETDLPVASVLLVGDEPSGTPAAAELHAAAERFDVTHVTDFVDAVDRVGEGGIDCVVTTHRPDGFDGLAFLEAVRREHADLPVVLVPVAVDAELARRAVAADVTALVPAGEADTLDAVVEAIETNTRRPDRGDQVRMPVSDLTVEAEYRLKERALDEAPIGITISDADRPDHPLIYVNDSFEDMTGYPPEEVIGANHRFLQGPKTDPDRVAELAEGIAAKRNTRVVLRNYTREGALFWNQVDISPIFDEDGNVTHYVGFQMDVTERKAAQEQLKAEREALDRLLERINGLINDVTEALVRAESREDTERLVTTRIGGGEEYVGAWLGRYDAAADSVTVVEQAGDGDAAAVEESFDLTADGDAVRALRGAIEDQETRTVEAPAELVADADGGTCVLVPLTYRGTTYGALCVLSEANFGDGRERIVLESLGRSIGTSINDVLTKRTITTDTVLNIGVELGDDDLFLVDLAATLDARFEHEETIADDQGRGVLTIVSTEHDDPEKVVETALRHDDVLAGETLVTTDDRSVVQFRLTNSPLVDVLSEVGSRVTTMTADSTSLTLEFRVGTERAASRVLDTLRERYDGVELTAYHEDAPDGTPHRFREELRNELTDRQLTALKKAYVSGYFEWPRRAEGTQLAESMDIVPSTYHQHLQAAKRKLVETFFEE